MQFEAAAEIVDGVPMMKRDQARLIYDHIRTSGVREILELGTAHGVSTTYMAAALDENGEGHITTVDRPEPSWDPPAEDLLARAGLSDRATVVRTPHSDYNWFLKQRLEERTDADGNTAPLYDLCYLDGAHLWTIDGFAAVLVERLLVPGGWLVLDDLKWTVEAGGLNAHELGMSEEEGLAPHMQLVFDLVVKAMPSFTEFRLYEDLDWGWALKAPGAPRRYSIETSRSLGAVALGKVRQLVRHARARRGTGRRL